MTAARRLTAILAADVVGYSRLMGEDEAGTARSVREQGGRRRPGRRRAERALRCGAIGRTLPAVARRIRGVGFALRGVTRGL